MKNFKTKIGITAAACFLTSSLAIKNVNAEYKPDPNIEKLVDTIMFDYPSGCSSSYELPDGRTVKFVFYGSTGEPYRAQLVMEITKYTDNVDEEEVETVRIRDYHLDGLGKFDTLFYKREIKYEDHSIMPDDPSAEELYKELKEFTELSKETQEKLKKEYEKIIKEAPSRIAEKHHKKEMKKIEEKEAKEEMFERRVLDLVIGESQP